MVPYRPKEDENELITMRRSTLLAIQDSVERAAAAASHAVKISTAARDAFEAEERRLSECARAIQKLTRN